MSRSGLGKQLLAWGTFGGVMLGGWALMTFTVPTKEEMLKRLPEETASQLSETEKRNAKVMEALRDTARSKEPMWRANSTSGRGRSTPNSSDSNSKRT